MSRKKHDVATYHLPTHNSSCMFLYDNLLQT